MFRRLRGYFDPATNSRVPGPRVAGDDTDWATLNELDDLVWPDVRPTEDQLQEMHELAQLVNAAGSLTAASWDAERGSLELRFAELTVALATDSTAAEQFEAMGRLGPVQVLVRVTGDHKVVVVGQLEHWTYLLRAHALVRR